ncbi:MAG: hypothetical protein WC406_10060, partial [Methanoregula sp.]
MEREPCVSTILCGEWEQDQRCPVQRRIPSQNTWKLWDRFLSGTIKREIFCATSILGKPLDSMCSAVTLSPVSPM